MKHGKKHFFQQKKDPLGQNKKYLCFHTGSNVKFFSMMQPGYVIYASYITDQTSTLF